MPFIWALKKVSKIKRVVFVSPSPSPIGMSITKFLKRLIIVPQCCHEKKEWAALGRKKKGGGGSGTDWTYFNGDQ